MPPSLTPNHFLSVIIIDKIDLVPVFASTGLNALHGVTHLILKTTCAVDIILSILQRRN